MAGLDGGEGVGAVFGGVVVGGWDRGGDEGLGVERDVENGAGAGGVEPS